MFVKLLHRNAGVLLSASILAASALFSSCSKDDDDKRNRTFNYAFNTGQVGAGTAYQGTHPNNLTASLKLEELDNAQTRVTISLTNTISGQIYSVHAHDAADPATTPNGTPYNEVPNANVLVQQLNGNGGTVSGSMVSNKSFSELTQTYNGFLVVHDPTQTISTTDLKTYLVVGTFAR